MWCLLQSELLLLSLKGFFGDGSLAERAVIVVIEPLSDARGVEEMPFIAWQWNDLILFGIIEQANATLLLRSLTTLGGIRCLELRVVKIGHKLWCSRDPSGLLLLARSEENERNEAAKKGANAAALKHLKVSEDDQDQSKGAQGPTTSIVFGVIVPHITGDQESDQCAHLQEA